MRIEFFDYQLADAAIARSPAEPRGSSRLLVLGSHGEVMHQKFAQLPQFLRAGDILVLNDTRVIPARLTGWRAPRSRGMAAVKIEVTLHQRVAARVISQDSEPKRGEPVTWKALVRPLKRLAVGDTIKFAENFAARVTNRSETGEVTLVFFAEEPEFWEKLSATGKVPLPPYLRREAESSDEANYQTVFAKNDGAVAAPTAGLHFTPDLLQQLEVMGVRLVYITLHVGAGTFLPVTVADTNHHRMHSEWAEVSEEAARLINDGRGAGGRIVAVGTTSLRVLESASDDSGRVSAFRQATNLFIQPGYRFKIVDLLITNFHVPRSSLLILVAALVGRKRILAVYELAMQLGYRFYSFGDACLLFRRAGEPEEDYND